MQTVVTLFRSRKFLLAVAALLGNVSAALLSPTTETIGQALLCAAVVVAAYAYAMRTTVRGFGSFAGYLDKLALDTRAATFAQKGFVGALLAVGGSVVAAVRDPSRPTIAAAIAVLSLAASAYALVQGGKDASTGAAWARAE